MRAFWSSRLDALERELRAEDAANRHPPSNPHHP
jgi:hypothetical protein